MTKTQQGILALNSLSMGIILPVLNLVLLSKGATLQTLPLIMALYSVTVFCLELPSGILADMAGRKYVFICACICNALSSVLLLFTNQLPGLILVALLMGLGRAFSSGSLEALFIDDALNRHGEGCLIKVTARMSVLDGGALALGGVMGGFISNLADNYLANIIVRSALNLVLLVCCMLFVQEARTNEKDRPHTSLRTHLQKGKKLLITTPRFSCILVGVFFTGFFLSTIETYWQPAFISLGGGKGNTTVLGMISALSFLAVIVGNYSAKYLMEKLSNKWWTVYNGCRIVFALCIYIFSVQNGSKGFVLCYMLVYMMLGSGSTSEAILVNSMTPDSMRASIFSLNSLMLQTGSFCASIVSSFVILKIQYSGLWCTAAILLGGCAIIVTFICRIKFKTENSEKTMQQSK